MTGNTHQNSEQNDRLMRRATYYAVIVASILILLKIWAYFATGSVAILATLVDSLLDLGASAINLIAVRHALTPADHDHRFGHGKAESLAGLFQSAFIVGSAIFLVLQAIERLANPTPINAGTIGIWVMVISIALTISLVLYQRHVIRKTNSTAISADALHYAGDILINVSVIVALILYAQFQFAYIDGLFAIAIAIYICFNAWSIIKQSFSDLMDEELPDSDRQKIKDVAMAQDGVLGVHDLRTRTSGQQLFIQMHLDLDPNMKLVRAHAISEAVEHAIMAVFPNAEALIHQDPAPNDLLGGTDAP